MTKAQYIRTICKAVKCAIVDGGADKFMLGYEDSRVPFDRLVFYRYHNSDKPRLQVQGGGPPTSYGVRATYEFSIKNGLRGMFTAVMKTFKLIRSS